MACAIAVPGTARIRALNDALRQSLEGGRVVITAGVAALTQAEQAAVLDAVRAFDGFDAANDPHGEHDFGSLSVAGVQVFWKIDAYDRALAHASPDLADPAVTTRILTIMLAEEW